MKRKKAFTLVELLVVIGIIGILTAILTFSFLQAQKRSRDTKRKSDLKTLQVAFEAYKTQQGKYPLSCTNGAATSLSRTSVFTENGTTFTATTNWPRIDVANFGCTDAGSIYDLLTKSYIASVPLDPNPTPASSGAVSGGYYMFTKLDGSNFKIVSYSPELMDITMGAECKNIAGEYYDAASGGNCKDYQVSSNSEVTKLW